MTLIDTIIQSMFDFTSPVYLSGVVFCFIIVSAMFKYEFKKDWIPRNPAEVYLYLACFGSWPGALYIVIGYVVVTFIFFLCNRSSKKNKDNKNDSQ